MKTATATAPQPAVRWRLRLQPPTTLTAAICVVADPAGAVIELVPTPAGTLLRCRIALAPPTALIAQRQARGQAVPPAMERGEMALEALLPSDHAVDVVLRLRDERIALHCDGVLVDEDWPFTARRGAGAPRILRSDLASALVVGDDREEIQAGAAAIVRWTPDAHPFGTYWRPPGANASAGDTMLCVRDDELHLFWLADRRWHRSRWGVGAHQFDHAVTSDLRAWTRLPRAVGIDAPWITVGTGTCVHDGERFHLFWHNHGERFAAPEGTFVSTSADGVGFAPDDGFHRPDLIQPGVWREDGEWRMLCHTRLYGSTDLRAWRLIDERFIAMPAGVTDECPCVFAHGGRMWLMTGRCGFWSWGPGERPRPLHERAPFDGQMVPMVAAWRGRLIMAGWVVDDAATVGTRDPWGGTLIMRELTARGDDGFALRWVPEMIPTGGPWTTALASTAVDGRGVAIALPAGPAHVRLDVAGGSDLAIVLGGDADGAGGTEIRLEASARRLLAARAPTGPFSGRADQQPFQGRDFALHGVLGLDQARVVDLVLWPDRGGVVIDVQLDNGHTLVTRHAGAWRPALALAA